VGILPCSARHRRVAEGVERAYTSELRRSAITKAISEWK
jgi:hypothetical protein